MVTPGRCWPKMRDVTERVAEEAEAIEAAADRLLLIGVARHAGDQRDVRIDAVADRHAFRRLDDVVVFLHPFRREFRFEEREGQRTQSGTRGAMDGLALGARHPHRRMRLLHRLGNQIAARHIEVRAAEAGIGTHRQHVGGLLGRLAPHRALFLGRDVEAFHLQRGRRFTGAPVGAAVRHQIERGDAFRHTRGMIVFRRHEHDAVARAGCASCAASRRRGRSPARRNANIPPGSGARPPTHSRCRVCRRVRPAPAPPGQAAFEILAPWLRQLVLVEHAEFHCLPPQLSLRGSEATKQSPCPDGDCFAPLA